MSIKVEYSSKKFEGLVVNECLWMVMTVFKDVVQGKFACLITIFHRKNKDTDYERDNFPFMLWPSFIFWKFRLKYYNHILGNYVIPTKFAENFI